MGVGWDLIKFFIRGCTVSPNTLGSLHATRVEAVGEIRKLAILCLLNGQYAERQTNTMSDSQAILHYIPLTKQTNKQRKQTNNNNKRTNKNGSFDV